MRSLNSLNNTFWDDRWAPIHWRPMKKIKLLAKCSIQNSVYLIYSFQWIFPTDVLSGKFCLFSKCTLTKQPMQSMHWKTGKMQNHIRRLSRLRIESMLLAPIIFQQNPQSTAHLSNSIENHSHKCPWVWNYRYWIGTISLLRLAVIQSRAKLMKKQKKFQILSWLFNWHTIDGTWNSSTLIASMEYSGSRTNCCMW